MVALLKKITVYLALVVSRSLRELMSVGLLALNVIDRVLIVLDIDITDLVPDPIKKLLQIVTIYYKRFFFNPRQRL